MLARRTISILLLVLIIVISCAMFRAIDGFALLTTHIPHAPYGVAYSTTLPTDESVTLKSSCGNGLDLGLDKQCYGCTSTSTSTNTNSSVMIQGPGNSSGLFCKAADGTLSQPVKSEKY